MFGVTGTENVWAPAQPVVKCLREMFGASQLPRRRARQPVKIANPSIYKPPAVAVPHPPVSPLIKGGGGGLQGVMD